MGSNSFYLGLNIKKTCIKKIIKLSQPAYIVKILAKYHVNEAKLCNGPMKEEILLPNKRPEASQTEQKEYQRMTGSIIFSMLETELDIALAISVIN